MTPLFHSVENVTHDRLDLYDLVTLHPHATFFMRYQGSDLSELSISKNDVLVIDRSVTPTPGNIVVVNMDGEFVIQKFSHQIQEDVEIWGVVCHAVHRLI
ncbi:MAG: hypothetical protein KBD10_01940 [Candidatus Pacebacteria bacterium]|nr:hypothetical protein [Candidatus Paceibacterota bacterium]